MEKGKKRRREEGEEIEAESSDLDHSLSLEKNLTFSDTLMALRIMRAQFPQIDKVSFQPFILQSQLYSSVKDRTQVDRELESLKREKVVRIFKLNTGQDDHGIMFFDDYLKQIDHVVKRMEERKQGDFEVFKWFREHVIESKLEPSIEHQELINSLLVLSSSSSDHIPKTQNHFMSFTNHSVDFHCSLLSLGGRVRDQHISLLINAGLITRQLIDPSMYWFAIPNIGSILKGLSQGRKELLSLLNRKRYKEMMLASLEKMRLRFSPLDMRFHLRDLIGSGLLKTAHTPTGIVIRISKD
ncbi:Serine-threonine protein kinase 19 [Corchorus olitorius]|uniref:Serine-threonine protein kinase 19 n=1 Tax=Corchorus olitorius TaxID=93759 RepID=A0A1R3KVR0_9ROSI|nr:Serine-threonine protein kinase 19 [Corchorus olitorius]